MLKRGIAAAWALLCAALPGGAVAQTSIPSPTLDAIRARGALACGINPGVAGFSLTDSRGVWQGFDTEMCRTSVDPNTWRLLGVTPELGQSLKLDPAWAYNVVHAVGNYGEIFNRTMGPDTPVGLARGPNRLHSDGGLLYALPMR